MRTNYPVRIDIPAKLFIEADRMNDDLRDIRFSDVEGNELPFWIHISEGMQRKVNNLPVYVKLHTLNPGENYVYLHFDKSKSKNDDPPGGSYCGDFVPTSEVKRTCSPTSGSFPYSHDNCGDEVFDLFAYTSQDADDWKVSGSFGSSDEKWVSKKRFSNEFLFHLRCHNYSEEMYAYFLTQSNSSASNLANYQGYRVFIDYMGIQSDNYHYNRLKYYLRVQKKTGGSWSEVDSFLWYPYILLPRNICVVRENVTIA
ncbi:MAG: hypothetical protein QME81_19640, partial [bacterium]|nr:hypothetical protein [bacterium]